MPSPVVVELPRPRSVLTGWSQERGLRSFAAPAEEVAAVELLEDQMRNKALRKSLQDVLSDVSAWSEGRLLTDTVLREIRGHLQAGVRQFLSEARLPGGGPIRFVHASHKEVVDRIDVRRDADDPHRVIFDIPTELNQWLTPPSMISF